MLYSHLDELMWQDQHGCRTYGETFENIQLHIFLSGTLYSNCKNFDLGRKYVTLISIKKNLN